MTLSRIVQLEVGIAWQSPHAAHSDRTFLDKVNFWRDFFPAGLDSQLQQAAIGEQHAVRLNSQDGLDPSQSGLIKDIPREKFNSDKHPGVHVEPRTGRFYPRHFVTGVSDIVAGDTRPLRCVLAEPDTLRIDLNHPMASREIILSAQIIQEREARAERGGAANDILHQAVHNGPGMQAALADVNTDFFSGSAFARLDNRADADFYQTTRLVQHIDSTARAHITDLYTRLLAPGSQVLDLMASWVSHLPDDRELTVHGLGMNEEELMANPVLQGYVVQDLNTSAALPFADASYDTVVCTVSVEYLVNPLAVFKDIARVLKPGGQFIVTFSDRWFPTKVIRVWQELHPFERMGLVLDYFRLCGAFSNLHTESVRGYPRPVDDAYAEQMPFSDPVYAVWGTKV